MKNQGSNAFFFKKSGTPPAAASGAAAVAVSGSGAETWTGGGSGAAAASGIGACGTSLLPCVEPYEMPSYTFNRDSFLRRGINQL